MKVVAIEDRHDAGRWALRPDTAKRPVQRVWSINVLVVEDDAADANLIVSVLKRNGEVASVRAIEDPQLALEQLAAGVVSPDLLLVDLRMPKINGFEFVKRLREIPQMRKTPVVILTSSALMKDALEAKHSSAVFYVIKPDSFWGLQARLDIVVARAISGQWSR